MHAGKRRGLGGRASPSEGSKIVFMFGLFAGLALAIALCIAAFLIYDNAYSDEPPKRRETLPADIGPLPHIRALKDNGQ